MNRFGELFGFFIDKNSSYVLFKYIVKYAFFKDKIILNETSFVLFCNLPLSALCPISDSSCPISYRTVYIRAEARKFFTHSFMLQNKRYNATIGASL